MSDFNDQNLDDDSYLDDADQTPPAPAQESPRALRDAAERGKQAARERDELVRKVAFLEAGIDTKTPIGQMFSKAYDGELTAEAITNAAKEVGVLKAETEEQPPPGPAITENERQQSQERMAISGDSQAPGPDPEPDPRVQGMKEFREAIANGQPREDAAGAWYGKVINAAANGDDRVISKG